MKNNIKALQLIESGLSSKTVSKLTESQINELHSKMVREAVTTNVQKTTYSPNETKGKTFQGNTTVNPDGSITVTKEGEIEEGRKKKSEPDVFKICHSQVGPKKTRKFERCVQAVKKSLKEGKNPVSLFLENEIMRIVEKHIPPRISKGDLLQYLSEDTETAPTKPITKPIPRPKPKSPGSNPHPGEEEAPRAKRQMGSDTETAPTKPITKPIPRPKPKSPGSNPHPGEEEAPRAISPERAKNEVINAIMKILNDE